MLVAGLCSLLSFSRVNHAFPCFSIICSSKCCLVMRCLATNLSQNGIMTEVDKLTSFPFKVTLTSFQAISNASQIQFLLKFMHSGVNVPLILNKCMLPTILHRFTGTYGCESNMNSITLVTYEDKCPWSRFDFLILFVTMNSIPNKSNSIKLSCTIVSYKYSVCLEILDLWLLLPSTAVRQYLLPRPSI